jgi:hypothetical protein
MNAPSLPVAIVTVLTPIAILWPALPVSAQSLDQWAPSKLQMTDYLANGYSFHSVIVDQVRPVSTKAILYFLTKGTAVVRCSETVTRRNANISSRIIGCSELTRPFTSP